MCNILKSASRGTLEPCSQTFVTAYRMQNKEGRPGPFHHMNDVNVYRVDRGRTGSPTELCALSWTICSMFSSSWTFGTPALGQIQVTLKSFPLLSTLVAVDIDVIHITKMQWNRPSPSILYTVLDGAKGLETRLAHLVIVSKTNSGAFCIHSGLCKYKHILVYLLWCCLAIKNLTVNNWAVIAQLCLRNLVCYLAPFNKHACVWGMYVNLEYCSTLHLAMYSSGVGNVHFTWWHENCLCCLSTVVAVVAWTINFTSAIQKWFFNLFYRSFSTMKLVDSFLLKVLCSNLSAGC